MEAGCSHTRTRSPAPTAPTAPNRVYVTGFPPYTQAADLARTFSQFGRVTVERLYPKPNCKHAVLAYTTPQEADTALQASKKVNIYGEFLHVRSYVERDPKTQPTKPDFSRSKQKDVIVSPRSLELTGPGFGEQVCELLARVRLTQEEATSLGTLYADVERVLQTLWPGCIATPFGSVTTGLGIKTSDADCFVQIPAKFQSQQHTFVNKAKRLLQTYPQIFAEILSIPRANTPIVKFFHIPTETNCDLSFKTPLGSQNSKLIAFLLNSDPRLIPFAVLVKYWAKVHGLTGTGRLTNYALTMMIIFYLQQSPRNILPSVRWLQRDPANDIIVDFWNTGFDAKMESMPQHENTSSIAELFGGFFEYYSKFDFEDLVICPFLGIPVKKELFVDVRNVPEEFALYKENVTQNLTLSMRTNTTMCVQDPFEQSHNVASSVSVKLAAEIKAYLQFAATSYEKEKLNGCSGFLKTILIDKPKIIKVKTHPEFRTNLSPKTIAGIPAPDWKAFVRETTMTIFEQMLKIKLVKVDEKVNPESKKEKERYTAMMTKAVWKRKQFSRIYGMIQNMDFTQKQTRITEEILNVEKTTIEVKFQLTIRFLNEPKCAAILIKFSHGDVNAFRDFGKFVSCDVNYWYTMLLKPAGAPLPEPPPNAQIASDNEDLNDDVMNDISNRIDDVKTKTVEDETGEERGLENRSNETV